MSSALKCEVKTTSEARSSSRWRSVYFACFSGVHAPPRSAPQPRESDCVPDSP